MYKSLTDDDDDDDDESAFKHQTDNIYSVE
jgi:hypothetical protein